MISTALKFFEDTHGKDCEFLSKNSVIDFAEQFARKFYAQKIKEAEELSRINDSFFEEKRTKLPPNPPLHDLP